MCIVYEQIFEFLTVYDRDTVIVGTIADSYHLSMNVEYSIYTAYHNEKTLLKKKRTKTIIEQDILK